MARAVLPRTVTIGAGTQSVRDGGQSGTSHHHVFRLGARPARRIVHALGRTLLGRPHAPGNTRNTEILVDSPAHSAWVDVLLGSSETQAADKALFERSCGGGRRLRFGRVRRSVHGDDGGSAPCNGEHIGDSGRRGIRSSLVSLAASPIVACVRRRSENAAVRPGHPIGRLPAAICALARPHVDGLPLPCRVGGRFLPYHPPSSQVERRSPHELEKAKGSLEERGCRAERSAAVRMRHRLRRCPDASHHARRDRANRRDQPHRQRLYHSRRARPLRHMVRVGRRSRAVQKAEHSRTLPSVLPDHRHGALGALDRGQFAGAFGCDLGVRAVHICFGVHHVNQHLRSSRT